MNTNFESPLNKSHRFERKAEDFEKCSRFKEAIECHAKAKECLLEAKKCASSLSSKQSIDAQIIFHESQKKILAHREAAFQHKIDIYKNKQKEQMTAKEEKRSSLNLGNSELQEMKNKTNVTNGIEIEKAIRRTIEEHDSLVQFLIYREDQAIEKEEKNININASGYKSGNKVPKGDKMVIEELRINNEQLRELIHQLLGELEKLRKENAELKSEMTKYKESSYLPELPPLEPPNLLY